MSGSTTVYEGMPFVYEGLPFDRYVLELAGVRASELKDILVSPRLYEWRRVHGREEKDVLRVGRAAHTAILEPHRFRAEYVTWEGGRRFGKEWDAFRTAHAGRTILTMDQLDTARQIAAAVRAHPIAAALLSQAGKAEVSITWLHQRTGLQCKSRIDWLCSALVDVKTCRDPAPHMFSGAAARLAYHVQAAFYSAALSSMGMELPVKIIAAQNVEPYDVAVYSVPDDVLLIGEQLYEAALDKLAVCQKAGSWPGIAQEAELELKLPMWAVPNFDDDLDLDQPGWSVSIAGQVP